MTSAASSVSALAKEPRQFYPEVIPPLNKLVIANVTRITDTAVYCELPAYMDMEAMIPISEIYIKRHRRVTDYVKEGQTVVAQVLRHDPIDLSLKIVREAERDAAMEAHGRDAKIHQIARTAAGGSVATLMSLLTEEIWTRGCGVTLDARGCVTDETGADEDSIYDGERVMAWMRMIRGSGSVDAVEAVPSALIAAIMTRLPEPIVTLTKDITLRFGVFHDGVTRLNALLSELAATPGLSVIVTAPPKYQLVATGPNEAVAAAILADASARLPVAC